VPQSTKRSHPLGLISISSVTAKVINHMGSVVAFSGKSVKGN
jgi:hypothetical protein